MPLRAPTSAELAADFGAAQDWIRQWQDVDPDLIRLEWKSVGGRLIGSNAVPHRAVLDSREQMWRLLRVTRQAERFAGLLDATRTAAPALVDWMAAHPMKVLAHEDRWDRLVATVRWIERCGGPDRYLRQVDVPGVDTKFIERHRGMLAALLDRQLAAGRVDPAYPPSQFAERYRFRGKPVYVRLRALGRPPATLAPYTEATLRVDELAATPIEADLIIVVENETTYLALPPVDGALVILGAGYAATALRPVGWLRERDLVYWGDIDTHGFVILDRLREAFPHTRSILMDHDTLLGHRAHWGLEPTPVKTGLTHLSPGEATIYADLVADTFGPALRLEQERIRFGRFERALSERWRPDPGPSTRSVM